MEREGARRPPALWIDLIRAQGRRREGRRRSGLAEWNCAWFAFFPCGIGGGLSSQWRRIEGSVARFLHSIHPRTAGKGKGKEGGACTAARSTRGGRQVEYFGGSRRLADWPCAYVCRSESAGWAGRCTESPARRSMPTPPRRLHGEGKETVEDWLGPGPRSCWLYGPTGKASGFLVSTGLMVVGFWPRRVEPCHAYYCCA